LLSCDNVPAVLESLLDTSFHTAGAQFGNIQLMNWDTGCLELATQRGFRADFLEYFDRVRVDDGSACALALRQRSEVVVEDVSIESGFSPLSRAVVLNAGVRAVQSLPMISTSGAFLGVLSVHFSTVCRPMRGETEIVKSLVQLAANTIISIRARQDSFDMIRKTRETIATSRDLLLRMEKSGSFADAP